MTKQVTITVIHKCKSCSDVGAKITNDTVVKCFDCNTIESTWLAQSFFEIDKKWKDLKVKSGVHLTMYPHTNKWVRIYD